MKMSEEEQIERMKRNQERMTNRKKSPSLASGAQSQNQGSDAREEVCQLIHRRDSLITLYYQYPFTNPTRYFLRPPSLWGWRGLLRPCCRPLSWPGEYLLRIPRLSWTARCPSRSNQRCSRDWLSRGKKCWASLHGVCCWRALNRARPSRRCSKISLFRGRTGSSTSRACWGPLKGSPGQRPAGLNWWRQRGIKFETVQVQGVEAWTGTSG